LGDDTWGLRVDRVFRRDFNLRGVDFVLIKDPTLQEAAGLGAVDGGKVGIDSRTRPSSTPCRIAPNIRDSSTITVSRWIRRIPHLYAALRMAYSPTRPIGQDLKVPIPDGERDYRDPLAEQDRG
jgi:hypothetical protein